VDKQAWIDQGGKLVTQIIEHAKSRANPDIAMVNFIINLLRNYCRNREHMYGILEMAKMSDALIYLDDKLGGVLRARRNDNDRGD